MVQQIKALKKGFLKISTFFMIFQLICTVLSSLEDSSIKGKYSIVEFFLRLSDLSLGAASGSLLTERLAASVTES